jgi:hypothetical protein
MGLVNFAIAKVSAWTEPAHGPLDLRFGVQPERPGTASERPRTKSGRVMRFALDDLRVLNVKRSNLNATMLQMMNDIADMLSEGYFDFVDYIVIEEQPRFNQKMIKFSFFLRGVLSAFLHSSRSGLVGQPPRVEFVNSKRKFEVFSSVYGLAFERLENATESQYYRNTKKNSIGLVETFIRAEPPHVLEHWNLFLRTCKKDDDIADAVGLALTYFLIVEELPRVDAAGSKRSKAEEPDAGDAGAVQTLLDSSLSTRKKRSRKPKDEAESTSTPKRPRKKPAAKPPKGPAKPSAPKKPRAPRAPRARKAAIRAPKRFVSPGILNLLPDVQDA